MNRQKTVDKLFNYNCSIIKHLEFKEIINDENLRTDIAKRLLDDVYKGVSSKVKLSEMKDLLKLLDRDIFQTVKERKLTYD